MATYGLLWAPLRKRKPTEQLNLGGWGVLLQIASPLNAFVFVGAVTILVFVFVALFITIIFHPQRRGIHDLLAGTICVRTATSAPPLSPVRVGLRLRAALWVIAVVSLAVSSLIVFWIDGKFGWENLAVMESWKNQGIVEWKQHEFRQTVLVDFPKDGTSLPQKPKKEARPEFILRVDWQHGRPPQAWDRPGILAYSPIGVAVRVG